MPAFFKLVSQLGQDIDKYLKPPNGILKISTSTKPFNRFKIKDRISMNQTMKKVFRVQDSLPTNSM